MDIKSHRVSCALLNDVFYALAASMSSYLSLFDHNTRAVDLIPVLTILAV